jgi:geranylgeranylglycerol-phosphate geranylgeranyltransferase
MAASAVILGFWISEATMPLYTLLFLVIAAISAISFGNVINDIIDIKTDSISHPERPLPKGEITSMTAVLFALFLCGVSLICSLLVSTTHFFATVVPVILLIIYSFFLKGTPLSGNILVGILVAYPLIYGGINGPSFNYLIIPALSAFLLNLPREIIKDLHDKDGDLTTGIVTSASLPNWLISTLIITCSILYLFIIFVPFLLHHFGWIYLIICIICALPIHIVRAIHLSIKNKSIDSYARIASLYKIEMFAGLMALLLDKLPSVFI